MTWCSCTFRLASTGGGSVGLCCACAGKWARRAESTSTDRRTEWFSGPVAALPRRQPHVTPELLEQIESGAGDDDGITAEPRELTAPTSEPGRP